MTLFFRGLARVPSADDETVTDDALIAPLAASFYGDDALADGRRERLLAWLARYRSRLRADGRQDADRAAAMNRVNPLYVPRNYLAQLAIDAVERGDPGELHAWMDCLRRPYEEQPGRERFEAKRPEWARRRAGCSMLSCSS